MLATADECFWVEKDTVNCSKIILLLHSEWRRDGVLCLSLPERAKCQGLPLFHKLLDF